EISFTQQLQLPDGKARSVQNVKFFSGRPTLALIENNFYLLRNAPPAAILEYWAKKPSLPVRKLSHRLLMQLRRAQSGQGVDCEQLCVAHAAKPQLVFELADDSVRLRLH